MNDTGTHIKTAVFVVFGFVACAILGQQISLKSFRRQTGRPITGSCSAWSMARSRSASRNPP